MQFRTLEGQEQLFWDINVGGTKNMIEAACFHKVARFIHVSSGSVVFNFKDFLDADENLPYVFHGTCGYLDYDRANGAN